jgi:HSP20 family protein
MNRLFDDVFGGFGLPTVFGPALRQMPAAPKIDVNETDNEIQVTAEMPGIDHNDVEVLLEDDRLIIRGEKREEREDKDRNYHVRERIQGAFLGTLPLPFAPDPAQVKAEFKNGVMTIILSIRGRTHCRGLGHPDSRSMALLVETQPAAIRRT